MNWLTPSIIATLCGTALLSGMFLYLYATYGHEYLKLWSLSWGCYALRLVAMLAMVTVERQPVFLFANQSLSLVSGTFLLAGVLSFVGREFSRGWWVATALGVGYIAAAISLGVSFRLLTFPTFTFLTVVTVWAGVAFLLQSRVRGLGSIATGWALILWGVHKADYPWLGNVEWFAPWGYLIGAVLAFVVALGILLTYFESLKDEYEAIANNYRALFHSAPYGIAVAEPSTGVLLDVNQALAEMSGRSREELVGQPQGILHPAEESGEGGLTSTFRRHVGRDLGNTLLSRLVTADGTVKEVEIKSDRAVLDGKEGYQGFFSDVTEKLAAEQEVAARDAKLRAVFEAATDVSFIITDGRDPEPTVLEYSPGAERLFGHTREEMMGRPVSVLHLPEDVARFPDIHRQLREGERTVGGETTLVRKNGERFPALFTAYPILGAKGEMTGVLGVSIDITLRKQAEETLSRQKHLLEKSQEMGHIGTWELDLEDGRMVWTDETCRIFGVPEGTVVTYELFLDKVHPEDRDQVQREWTAAFDGRPYDVEHRIEVDGEVRWVREKAEIRLGEDGRPVGAIGFAQDITELKRFEAERERWDAQLRETQKLEAIGTLAGGVAHDFNNILGAMLGYSELALQGLSPDSEPARDVREVVRAGERAKELVKQILAFSRRSEQARRPIQAHVVVREAMGLLRQTIPSSIPIHLTISERDDLVLADPTQLHQVVMNLCTNAHHALRDRDGSITVRLEALDVDPARAAVVPDLKPGPYVQLTVADTGKGMDPVTLSRAYEPFFYDQAARRGNRDGAGCRARHRPQPQGSHTDRFTSRPGHAGPGLLTPVFGSRGIG